MRLALALIASLSLAGCLNWRAGYEYAARKECNSDPDETARRACLDHLEQEQRDHDRASRARKSQAPQGS